MTKNIVAVANVIGVKHCDYVDWRLLTPADLQQLLPGCTTHVERFLGLPKSLVAYKRS